jgi:hypothetical protein
MRPPRHGRSRADRAAGRDPIVDMTRLGGLIPPPCASGIVPPRMAPVRRRASPQSTTAIGSKQRRLRDARRDTVTLQRLCRA